MAKAKFDIRTEATRPFYAGVGVTDLAVGAVREYVADVQKKLSEVRKDVGRLDLEPAALRDQAVTVVNARVDALSKDAKARRAAIEARVAELQDDARTLPTKVQALVNDNVATVNGTYAELVKRGESLVGRIRRQEATQATVRSAETTSAKAKTTRTQTAKTTRSAAKQTSTGARSTAKKATATARKSPAGGSAKATSTAARKTASNATQAVADGAQKVGE